MITRVVNIGGINTYVNPLIEERTDNKAFLTRAVNVDSYPYGGKSKRPGYITFLGTADGSAINSLFSWTKEDGTTLFNYRASGSSLYYSIQGTGAWTLAGNGTISVGKHVGYAVLGDTLIMGDGAGSTRHTTNGTSFTNTTLAPIGEHFTQFQRRIYIGGTSSTLFYSTTNDATNWNTSGTSDSSSFTIPGAGKINKVINANNRLVATKNSGLVYRWDGYSLVDTSTSLGPTSPYSVSDAEGYFFWLNRLGHFGYGGDKPKLLSNAIQGQVYNNMGSGIAGANFTTAPGIVHKYDWLCAVGTVTDDFTNEPVANAIIKYSFQKNEYLNYSFNNNPTAWHSYVDANGINQLIFGDNTGQCYQMSGTATTDNGAPIASLMQFVLDHDNPELDKKYNWFWAFFNPGCEANIQVAISDTYRTSGLNWVEIGDASSGVAEFRFPEGSRGKLLFVKIYESSSNTGFRFYGCVIDAELIPQ